MNETLTADDLEALGLDVDTSDEDVVEMINAALAADEGCNTRGFRTVADAVN